MPGVVGRKPGGAAGNPGGTAGVTGAASVIGGDSAGEAEIASCDPRSDSTAIEDVGERGGTGTTGYDCESFFAF